MNGLKYLDKRELDSYLDNLYFTSLIVYRKFDGKICKLCNIKQGFPHKGWNKYYCKHTERKVSRILDKYEKEAMRKLLTFVLEHENKKEKQK